MPSNKAIKNTLRWQTEPAVVSLYDIRPGNGAGLFLQPAPETTLGPTVSHQWRDKHKQQAVRGRPPRYAPAPLVPLWAPKLLAPPSTPQRSSIVSHAEYVPTLTTAAAWRVKAALSKAAWWHWPLTFWPWKWCPSHIWRTWATPMPILVFPIGLSLFST